MARPKNPILSRQNIAEAAMSCLRSNGKFTVSAIARNLGVNPASLYHHVPGGKHEIVRLIRELIYGDISHLHLRSAEISWEVRLREWIDLYRNASARIPEAMLMLVSEQVDDNPTLELYETAAVVLHSAGLSVADVQKWLAAIDAIVFGSVVDLLSPEPLWLISASSEQKYVRLAELKPHRDAVPDAFQMLVDSLISSLKATLQSPREFAAP